MERTNPQRKACDLCYRKKIKCDLQEPHCSTCISYNSPCTHEAASRKKGARKQQAARRDADMKSTIHDLEQQLATALSKIESLEKATDVPKDVYRTDEHRDIDQALRIETPKRKSYRNLPPYQDALAIVEEYLATFNSVFPLFDPDTVLRTLRTWYQNPDHHDSVTWALINVVLALAHHTNCSANTKTNVSATTYLNNAQSVLSDVISGNIDLVNVQIPLGLAMLFWYVNDAGPAMILVATALRLAHRIGLPSKKASRHLPPAEIAQRNRVFWVAYILDRDTSIFARVAPIQLDSDIDVDLPPYTLDDDFSGFVFTANGDATMNFFRARVQLAQIQGKVYEYVYSLSAQNATADERSHNIILIYQALDDWSHQIPLGFRPFALLQNGFSGMSRYFSVLYAVRLRCRALISHASSGDSFHNSKWVENVRDYGESSAAGQILSRPPISPGWQTLLEESRAFMALVETMALTDTFLFSLAHCAYFTGLLCLTANAIFDTRPEYVHSDERQMNEAARLLEEMSERPGADRIRQLRNAVRELRSYADVILQSRIKRYGLLPWESEPAPVLDSYEVEGWQSMDKTCQCWFESAEQDR